VCTVPLPPGVNPIAVDKYIYLSIFLHFGEVFKHRNWTVIVSRNNVGFVNKPFCLMLSKWCSKPSDTLRLKKYINKV